MRIYVDHSKLTDAPYSQDRKDSFDLSLGNRLIADTSDEIVHGNPTCFIVSGYRGAGKTSFLKLVQDKIRETSTKDRPIAFVEISLPSKIETNILLRRIIRRIYLSISDQGEAKKYLQKNNPDVLDELEDLYQRTFFEIGENAKRTKTSESAVEAKLTADMKTIIIVMALLLSAIITSKFEILTWLLKLPQKDVFASLTIDEMLYSLPALYFIYMAYLFITEATLKITQSKKNKLLSEKSIKRLYDDDIAEDHLWRTLGELSKTNVKVIFVIDELDKIENDDELQSLIKALKPLMLSGLASFILVTGQGLYYKFHSIHTSDDAILASLFSRSIHVPLLSVEQFRTLFHNMYISTEAVSQDQIASLVDSIILESNRIPRRFYGIIRQKLHWGENKAYIELERESEKAFRTHSRLLEIIQFIEQNNINPEYKEGIKDFFVSQLHLIVQRMLTRRWGPFTRRAVCETEDGKLPLNPELYLPRLNKFADSLLDACVTAGLLTKEVEITEDGEEEVYNWTDQAEAAIELSDTDPRRVESSFIQAFTDMERVAREIHSESVNQTETGLIGRKIPLRKLLADLVERQLFFEQSLDKLGPIIKLRNRLVHEGPVRPEDLKIASDYELTLVQIRRELLFNFAGQLLTQHLKMVGYQLGRVDQYFDPMGLGFSFKAISIIDHQRPDILFAITSDLSFVANPEKSRDSVLKRMAKYEAASKKDSVAIIFLYIQAGIVKGNHIKINNENRDTKIDYPDQEVFIRIISESRNDQETDNLEIHLDEILAKMGIERTELSASSRITA